MATTLICPNCGYIGEPKRVMNGSCVIELVLWLFLLPLGVLYTVWRLTTKYSVCPECEATNMIRLDSPRGRKLRQELSE